MADNWYAQRGDKQVGPVSPAKLRQAFVAGRLKPEDLVWAEGWPEWRAAGEVSEIAGDPAGAAAVTPAVTPAQTQPAESGVYDLAEAETPAMPQPAAMQPAAATLSPQAPAARPLSAEVLGYRGASHGSVEATPGALEALGKTRPWVMLFAVLLFIGCAFGALGGLAMIGIGAAAGAGAGAAGPGGGPPAPPMFFFVGMGVVYLLFTAIYFFPALYLVRYFSAIGTTLRERQPADLERALTLQMKFWRFVGIAVVVVIVLYFLFFALAIVAGFAF